MDKFDCISPLDYRYYGGDSTVLEKLRPYLSERAAINYQLRVEAALAETLADEKLCGRKVAEEIKKACSEVTAEEVYEEEKRIRHNVRALANSIRKRVSAEAKPYVHFTATSNDIISTAESMRLKDAVLDALLPQLLELERTLVEIAKKEKDTLQIGRTHGQHAEPITFGFTVASYVSRLGGRIHVLKSAAEGMKGKFSGAVGAYNSLSLFVKNPAGFEERLLRKLKLNPATHSTQILEPEYAADLMHAVVTAFGVMANIADDMRHLQRTEIGEVAEEFGAEQVGSSTMPHKRNPISFENVKSLWKQFMPRMVSVYADQISEHQRDLTNSASSRFLPELLAAAHIAAVRLNKAMSRLAVVKENMRRNLGTSRNMMAAEPAYLLLAAAGFADAHEWVRKLTLEAERKETGFHELLMQNAALKRYVSKFTSEQVKLLNNPELYTGVAAEKAEKVCRHWEKKLGIWGI